MNRVAKIAIFLAVGCGVFHWVSSQYLAPIEKRVEALADAADKAGLNEEPPDIEVVCGTFNENMQPEAMAKMSACYQAESQKQIAKLNKVLKAGNLPTLGNDSPCDPGMFAMVGDNNVGSDLMKLLYEKKTAQAHALLSADMRAKVPEAELTAYVDKLFWRGKTIAGAQGLGSASLSGSFTCDGKAVVPVTSYEFTLNDEVAVKATMEAVQENGTWKVRAIERIDGSTTQDPKQAPLPDEKQLLELASEAIHSFIGDTSTSRIDQLYSGSSLYLRGATSRKALEAKFAPYFGKYDFLAIEGKPVTITAAPKAVVMDRGFPVFEVQGTQPSTGGPINFTMKFAYDNSWRLADIAVRPGT